MSRIMQVHTIHQTTKLLQVLHLKKAAIEIFLFI